MSKKRISLIQAIIQLVALVSLFLPISFTRCYTILYPLKTYQYGESVFEALDWTDHTFLALLLIFIGVVNVAYFVLRFATKLPQLKKKYCIAFPCIVLPFLVLSVIAVENYKWRSSDFSSSVVYGTAWGFYLVCAFYLSIIFLELYKHFSKLEEESEPRKPLTTTIVQHSSPADEIKKYQDLFNAGIITQEEFDAKKKELLGL